MQKEMKKQEYKWVILGVCFLMVFTCLGFGSGSNSLYLAAVSKALNVKRSLLSLKDTFRFISSAAVSLFFGTLVYHLNIRRTASIGIGLLVAAMLVNARAESVLGFYLGGLLLGAGFALSTNTMASCIIRRWFEKDIGKYTGLVFSANGIGSAVVVNLITPMINREGDPFGYRDSYLLIAGMIAAAGVVVLLLLRNNPQKEFTPVVVKDIEKGRKLFWEGIRFEDALKCKFFYLAAIVVFVVGFMLQGINGVYVANLTDIGFDVGFIAIVASIFSLTLTFSKILVGVVYDKFGLRIVMLVCQIAAVVAFLILAVLKASTTGKVFAIVFVVLYALSLPLETLVVPLIVSDIFGTVSYEKFLGLFIAINYAGYALGSPAVNLCYDVFGSYRPILILCGVLMMVACVLFQWVITDARRRKNELTSKAV